MLQHLQGEPAGRAPAPASAFSSPSSLAEDLARNRELYANQEVRPPFTYAALLKQVKTSNPVLLALRSVGAGSVRGSGPADEPQRDLQLVLLHLRLLPQQSAQLEGELNSTILHIILAVVCRTRCDTTSPSTRPSAGWRVGPGPSGVSGTTDNLHRDNINKTYHRSYFSILVVNQVLRI